GDVGGPGARAPGANQLRSGRGEDGPRPSSTPSPADSSGAALDAAALALGQAAPDAEPFVVFQGVLKALGTHLDGAADLFGLSGGAPLLRKERFRIGLSAQGDVLPGHPPRV